MILTKINSLTDTRKQHIINVGDLALIYYKIIDGLKERIHIFEGICIAKKNHNISSSFTIRRSSFKNGVEKIFPLYSPLIVKIVVKKSNIVRRAKLYYLKYITKRKKQSINFYV